MTELTPLQEIELSIRLLEKDMQTLDAQKSKAVQERDKWQAKINQAIDSQMENRAKAEEYAAKKAELLWRRVSELESEIAEKTA